jgi:ferric-dicitrate binding protein FerR (iron transport regulator)
MDKHYFIKLLNKYHRGDSTKEEEQFLASYYNLFQHEPDILNTLSTEEREKLRKDIKDAIWSDVPRDIHPVEKGALLSRRLIKVAAAAIFIAFVTGLFFLSDKLPQKQVSVTGVPAALPPGNRVIFLADGSSVILSPGSKLSYPSSFEGMEKREVFLTGQAFFDVKHNPAKPFIVQTGNLETIVLGTAFNIRAIPGEKDITVTVTKGRVKVINENKTLGIITPNQQIIYDRGKISFTKKVVDNDHYLNWKEDNLLFDNLTIAEAAELLQKRYNVRIVISDQSISSQRFTATFSKDESFEQALKSICEFNEVSYSYNTKDSTVYINNK